MRIGVDIEKVSRFELDRDSSFVRDVFSEHEISYAYSRSHPAIHLCGMFCAKEATLKTLTRRPAQLRDIRVLHDLDGAPLVEVAGVQQLGSERFLVSISHCEDYGVASVVRK